MKYTVPEFGEIENVGNAVTSALTFCVRSGLQLISTGPIVINYEYFDFGRYEVSATIETEPFPIEISSSAVFSGESIEVKILEKSKTFSISDSFSEIAYWMKTAYENYLKELSEPIIW